MCYIVASRHLCHTALTSSVSCPRYPSGAVVRDTVCVGSWLLVMVVSVSVSVQANYLRAQIARISSTTVCAPSGLFSANEDGSLEKSEEFGGFPGRELSGTANWVHRCAAHHPCSKSRNTPLFAVHKTYPYACYAHYVHTLLNTLTAHTQAAPGDRLAQLVPPLCLSAATST